MTQADPSDDVQAAEDGALTRLEHKLCLLEQAVRELLAEETFSPRRPASRTRRHRHPVRLYVITGGLAALLGLAPALPAENPMRMAVDYTISALVQQMPSSIPDPPDLGPVVIGNPDSQHQPLHPVAAIKSVLSSASPSAPPQASPTPAAVETGLAQTSVSPTWLPIVTPSVIERDSHHASSPASPPTPTPFTPAPATPLPSTPPSQGAVSPSAAGAPVSDKHGRKWPSPTPSPSLGLGPSPTP